MGQRKILSAFVMLLITMVALTTASYAWFSVNTNVQLAGLDVNVNAAEGIQVSTDAVNWKASVSGADLAAGYAGHKNQLPTTLTPMSTIGSQTAGNFEMFYGMLVEGGTTTLTSSAGAAEAAGTSGNFIAFDLFVKATSSTNIWLNNGSSIVYSGSGSSVGLEYSTRVAFLNQGTDATSTPATAMALAAGTSASQVIWEPYATSHTVVATGNGASGKETYYGLKATGTGLSVDIAQQAIDAAEPTPVYFDDVTTITPDTDGTPFEMIGATKIFTAGAGITKVRIYIWIEGQDVDCENTASLGKLTDAASKLVATIQFQKQV